MRVLHMREQTSTLCITLFTEVTRKPILGIVRYVNVAVSYQFILPSKPFATNLTLERSLAGVTQLVNF